METQALKVTRLTLIPWSVGAASITSSSRSKNTRPCRKLHPSEVGPTIALPISAAGAPLGSNSNPLSQHQYHQPLPTLIRISLTLLTLQMLIPCSNPHSMSPLRMHLFKTSNMLNVGLYHKHQ